MTGPIYCQASALCKICAAGNSNGFRAMRRQPEASYPPRGRANNPALTPGESGRFGAPWIACYNRGSIMLSLARGKEGEFKLVSGYRPQGDQPAAIESLIRNLAEIGRAHV